MLINNFTLRLEKCEFFQEKITFLSHVLSSEGIVADDNRIKLITEFDEPKTQRQLQQILGICNYYRRFVLNHNSFITPLRDLLMKDAICNWTEKYSEAYKALKNNFARCHN